MVAKPISPSEELSPTTPLRNSNGHGVFSMKEPAPLIMARKAYSKHDPEKGDIVIIQSTLTDCESGKDKFIVKRIVGVPGDIIAIRNNTLYLNNQKYIEEYTKDGVTPAVDIPGDGSSVAVPESCYYVLGDNRCNSIDSRSRDVGFINRSDIKGKVVVRLYPFSKIRSY